ncbi:MAG: TIM barrel protein [Rhizobiaceae bacterium]|jgi:xylose isomerase|nr:TIM barrel protein [Rhizobiaceae bacterium]
MADRGGDVSAPLQRPPLYAARLNAFKIGIKDKWPGRNRITTLDLIERAAGVPGLNAADLNYPDHFDGLTEADIGSTLERFGVTLNGLAMRYYTEPEFKLGAFTHPDRRIRRAAIDITKRGIDAGRRLGSQLMTLWMGQDGFDTSFQLDYAQAWDWTIEALHEVAAHDPETEIAIEYKPNEPRAFALMPDVGTTLLAIRQAGNANLGVTLDFAHVLYADEMPAFAAHLVARHSKLMGVHLNDGYGKRDDGLMVGTVHPVQTVELLVELLRQGYSSAIYFDTFPDHSGLDPEAECAANIAVVERLKAVAAMLADDAALAAATARQDAPAAHRIVSRALYGA